jgi:hypothetical protein
MWAVDLNTGPSASLASFQLFDFLTVGRFEARKGIYAMGAGDTTGSSSTSTGRLESAGESDTASQRSGVGEARHFVSCELLTHPGFPAMEYASLFRACRAAGEVFDMEARTGTAFSVTDHPAAGILGLLHGAPTLYDALAGMARALELVDKVASGGAQAGGLSGIAYRDTLNAMRYLAERLRPLVRRPEGVQQ